MSQRPRTKARLSRRRDPEGQSADSSSEEGSSVPEIASGSKSPLSMSRVEEKKELQSLNERLAEYIEFVQQSSSIPGLDNVDVLAETVKEKLHDLSDIYKDELAAVRKNLDKIALQLTERQVQLKAAVADRDEADKSLHAIKAREAQTAKELSRVASDLARVQKELDHTQHIKADRDGLTKQLDMLKSQLEQETLLRTDLQNQVQTLSEQLDFKEKLLQREREVFSTETLKVQMKTVANETEKYRTRLKQKMNELRDEMNLQMQELVAKLNRNVEVKLKAEKQRARMAEDHANDLQVDQDRLNAELTNHMQETLKLRSELERAHAQIRQLTDALAAAESRQQDAYEQNKFELDRILKLLSAKSLECAELAGINVQLDAEIAMYRSLLESEEYRCHLSPPGKILSGTPLMKKRTAKRPAPAVIEVDLDDIVERRHETQAQTASLTNITPVTRSISNKGQFSNGSIRITCESNGPVHFANTDPADGLIHISNASDTAVRLGDWRLRFDSPLPNKDIEHTMLHVFSESQVLQPHSDIQIHLCSSSGDQVDHIVTRKRRREKKSSLYLITDAPVWQPKNSAITLLDSKGVARAVCEINPTGMSESTKLGLPGRQSHDNSTRVTCKADGYVHFEVVESGDGVLRICNARDEVVDLAGWVLTYQHGTEKVTSSLTPNAQLAPNAEIRVVLRKMDDDSRRAQNRDKSVVTLQVMDKEKQTCDSTYTLTDSHGTVCAESKWEVMDESEVRSGMPNWDSTTFSDARQQTSKSWSSSSRASGSMDPAFVNRYKQFVVSLEMQFMKL